MNTKEKYKPNLEPLVIPVVVSIPLILMGGLLGGWIGIDYPWKDFFIALTGGCMIIFSLAYIFDALINLEFEKVS